MKLLIQINRRRILPFEYFIYLSVVFVIFSVFIIKKEGDRYLRESYRPEISDGTEYRDLMEDKVFGPKDIQELIELYNLPQNPLIVDQIEIEHLLIVQSINQTLLLGERSSNQDFFSYRMMILEKIYRSKAMDRLDYLRVGYCEGWKVFIRNFDKFFYMLGIVFTFLFLPVMKEDDRLGTRELVGSTLHGKADLFHVQIINALEVGVTLYCWSLVLFFLLIILVYGPDGGNLLIQNSQEFFLLPFNWTYYGYCLYKIILGLDLVLITIMVILFISNKIDDLRFGFSLLFLYYIFHFLPGSLSDRIILRELYLLSPLNLLKLEDFNKGLSYSIMLTNYILSLILPLILAGCFGWMLSRQNRRILMKDGGKGC